MDDIFLSPELDGNLGMPTFEDYLEEQVTEKGGSWDNDPTTNASWEQNASAGNDSDNWGGWSNAAVAADTGAAKPADQANSSWNVPAIVENDSADWWAGALKRGRIRRLFQKNQLKSTLGLITMVKRMQMDVVLTGVSSQQIKAIHLGMYPRQWRMIPLIGGLER